MNRLLLTGLLSAAVIGASAAAPVNFTEKKNAAESVKPITVRNASGKATVRHLAPGVTETVNHGIKKLNVAQGPKLIKKPSRTIYKASKYDGLAFFESFENWDGQEPLWIPEGWELDHRGKCEPGDSWTPSYGVNNYMTPADGNVIFGINYSSKSQDEWLITPEIKIEEGYQFTFWYWLTPYYLFKEDNVDWENYEYIGEKEVSATLQLWALPEGGEWTMLHDVADDYKDLTLDELLNTYYVDMQKKSIGLDQFAGKTVKIAFRLVGQDGNTIFIDAVGVGYPLLDDVSFMDPFDTLYFGVEPNWQLSYMPADIAQYGVYYPTTWSNLSYNEGATYSWTYEDPKTHQPVTADGEDVQYDLTLTFEPDYTSEATLRNNLYTTPVLTASAPNASDTQCGMSAPLMQAGGTCEFVFNNGTTFNGSYLPFGINTNGLAYLTLFDDKIGDPAIPIFGYNKNANQYWLNYSLNGEPAVADEYSKVEGIANLFWASETPVVVNGLTLGAYGQVADDVEFTATILGLDSEYSKDLSTMEKIATTTITGSSISREYSDANGFMMLEFNFDEPVVLSATEEHPAYFLLIEGFNNEKVEYFAPLQSEIPLANYLCWGYILAHVDLSAQTGREAYYNIKPMQYKDSDEYVDLYAAFAIGMKAEFPWLTTECEGIELADEAVTVDLGSYYDGSKLTVEAPAGVKATVAGRYDKCVLTVAKESADVEASGDIVVKGPGVELTIPVTAQAGIADIVADGNKQVTAIYDLNGRRVDAARAAGGVYVVKYSDGTVAKRVVK